MALLVEGQRFERYRVIRWLGSGVAGESYEVENMMLQQKATLKLIHPWATLAEAARRQFFREMQSICMFRHPYLAEVVDYGEIDAQLYVARRYMSNGSLLGNEGRLWFRPPLPVNEAIEYGDQLAQVLEYVHQQNYVHGAFTLGNILVLRGPNTGHMPGYAPFLLADVGLAHFTRRFGQSKLSPLPLTAAPEQLGNEASRVSPASDQFALAVIIYLWLAGRPPYLGTPEEIEQLKLTETITPLTTLNPLVTFEQEGVLGRALSVHPEDRYPSIQAFADALMATLHRPSQPLPAELVSSQSEPLPEIPALEPLPKPEPDIIIPIPDPEPKPEPLPEPAPQPTEPKEPATEPLPKPEPDIIIPIPDPTPVPEPIPETEPPSEIAVVDTSISQQEAPPQEQKPGKHDIEIARLVIFSPFTEATVEAILDRDELTIGRAGSSDILLDFDDNTSRHHALLRHEGGQYVLYDQQSATGVFVNEKKIPENTGHALADGDHIRIGNYELTFLISTLVHNAGQ